MTNSSSPLDHAINSQQSLVCGLQHGGGADESHEEAWQRMNQGNKPKSLLWGDSSAKADFAGLP